MGKQRPQDLVKIAESQGWRVQRTKMGWLLFPPDVTRSAVSLHKTPSDHRWYANAVGALRRSGLIIDVK